MEYLRAKKGIYVMFGGRRRVKDGEFRGFSLYFFILNVFESRKGFRSYEEQRNETLSVCKQPQLRVKTLVMSVIIDVRLGPPKPKALSSGFFFLFFFFFCFFVFFFFFFFL